MGSIADFYVGRGAKAEWVGSIAWEGDPMCIARSPGGLELLKAGTESEFREALRGFLDRHPDAVSPPRSWPWPWSTSALSDRVYAFDGDRVWATQPFRSESLEARHWFDPRKGGAEPDSAVAIEFPDMTSCMVVPIDEDEAAESAYAMGGLR